MSGVFSGQQWTQASGSTWSVLIEPDFVNEVAELCNHLALAGPEARSVTEGIVTKSQQASGDSGSLEARKDVVRELMQKVGSNGLNQGAQAQDLEGFANLAVSLARETFEDAKEAEPLFVQLADGLCKSASNDSQTAVNARYSAISSIFNSLSESTSYETRASILLSLVKLAVSKDELSVLSSALSALPSWLSSQWGIAESSASDKIMLSVVAALEQAPQPGETAEVIRALLAEYANENTEEALKAKLLLYSLASPTTFDIESLPNAPSHAELSKLRDIFLSGSLADLSSVAGSLPAPLEAESLREKLQYVVLADYCSRKVGQTISYDEVAENLGLQSSADEEEKAMEVESWIIATIRVKLLAARLHQPSNTVSILRASPRRFGPEQWATLQARLESWKSHVSSILDTVGRAVGPAQQQQQAVHHSHSQQRERQHHDAQSLVAAQQEQETSAAVEVA